MSFKDIIGQDKAAALLGKILKERRVGQAYLFVGPDGVGKGISALTFAKALNCLKSDTDPCGACESCTKIERSVHPDVSVLKDSADKVKIHEIRALQNAISLKPYEGKNKVFIIENAERLTEDAAHAFLKTLEEPPGHSVIILTGSNLERILPTIQSRCHIIRFLRLGVDDIKGFLVKRHGLDESEAQLLARLSNGSLSRAMGFIDKERLQMRRRLLDDFIKTRKSFSSESASWLFGISKTELKEVLGILESVYRDMLVAKIGGPSSVLLNKDRQKDVSFVSSSYSVEEIFEMLGDVQRYKFYLDRNVNTKLLVDQLLI